MAILLVLSGAGVTLSPTQAFADGGKEKPEDDKHKKSEDDKDKLLKAQIESITARIKDEHKSESVTATTESEEPKKA